MGVSPSPEYVRTLKVAINSDGCTGVIDVYGNCCVFHDLGYRFHIDIYGRPVDRNQVDDGFRRCMQKKSLMKWFNPMSWWRYAAVRWIGDKFYSICPPEHEVFYYPSGNGNEAP